MIAWGVARREVMIDQNPRKGWKKKVGQREKWLWGRDAIDFARRFSKSSGLKGKADRKRLEKSRFGPRGKKNKKHKRKTRINQREVLLEFKDREKSLTQRC